MSETLEAFMQRKSDPKWRAKPLPKPSTKIRKFTPNDVARDMQTYQYKVSDDYRRIRHPKMLTLDEWMQSMRELGAPGYKAKKLPTLGSPPKLSANARAEELRRVKEWIKMTPEKRVQQLEDARRFIQKDYSR